MLNMLSNAKAKELKLPLEHTSSIYFIIGKYSDMDKTVPKK